MRPKSKLGLGILMIIIVLMTAVAYDLLETQTAYENQSIIDNIANTTSYLNLSMEVQYWNETSGTWNDSIDVYNNLIEINESTVALDQYWNNSWWDTSDLSQGYGTYRVYAKLVMPNGSIVSTDNGTLMEVSYNFTYAESTLNITSMVIEPDEDGVTPGAQINPSEDSNVTVNITINMTNNTAVDTCFVRIFNSSDDYSSPTLGPYQGTIDIVAGTTQCFANWSMEYWRNAGDWNVSVDVNTTYATTENDNTSYYYNTLVAHSVNVSYINISGTAGQTVNSITAYPLEIKNTGNAQINITINSTDFIGMDNPSYSILAGNLTYNESAAGDYRSLTATPVMVFDVIVPTEIKDLYFRGIIPSSIYPQEYQGNVTTTSN